ncbi:RNase P modulator RnpM [Liberiplasma polymorphum]|uniref:RNase P modulator RnpM n=1 Tax=Liberiplasma polymorphum TaxID=3374570 RepID=UPI0037767FE4
MNKKVKKIPLRKCVVTNERFPKQELIRIVKNNENQVFIDLTGKQNGRGAYLKKSKSVILKAQKTKKLDRHLEVTIDESIYEELLRLIDEDEL